MLHLTNIQNGEKTIQIDITMNVQQWDVEQEYLQIDTENAKRQGDCRNRKAL